MFNPDEPINLEGVIKARYPNLTGRDWINSIEPLDRTVVMHMVRSAGEYGRLGGIARAATADRDENGRFKRSE